MIDNYANRMNMTHTTGLKKRKVVILKNSYIESREDIKDSGNNPTENQIQKSSSNNKGSSENSKSLDSGSMNSTTSTQIHSKNNCVLSFSLFGFVFLIQIAFSIFLVLFHKKTDEQQSNLNKMKMMFCKFNKDYDFCKENIIIAKYIAKSAVQDTALMNEIHPLYNYYIQIDRRGEKFKNKYKIRFQSEGEHLVIFYFGEQQLITMKEMFKNIATLEEIDLSGLWSQQIQDMKEIFSGCTRLKSVNLIGMDTSKVTNMEGMFYNNENLQSLDLSLLDTKNVQEMRNMFAGMTNLKDLDISGFNLEKIYNEGDIEGIFDGIENSTDFHLVYNSKNNQDKIISLISDKAWIKEDLNKK